MTKSSAKSKENVSRLSNIFRNGGEFFAALLLALATITSAWCGYQSTKWGGTQSILAGEAGAIRSEAVQKANLAGQVAVIDITMFEKYLEARLKGESRVAERIMSRFRPEAKVAIDAWLATDPFQNPSAPKGPFSMKEYRSQVAEEYAALIRLAEEKTAQAQNAIRYVDQYVFLTILLASVLFFAGISFHFALPLLRRGVLLLAAVLFVATLFMVVTMPMA